MSLSNQTQVNNPTKRFFKWKAGDGELTYWDSEVNEEITVERPFKFIVLDELSCVTGYYEPDNAGIYSNEVSNLAEQTITVRTKVGILGDGLYKDIKDVVKGKGGKYTRSLYIATYIDNVLSIANIKLAGAAFGAWLDFTKQGSIYKNWTIIDTHTLEGKKGATKFKMPVFVPELMEDVDRDEAIELDKELQEYLKAYRISARRDVGDKLAQTDVMAHMSLEDMISDDPDDKIDLSQIPF